MPGDKPSVGLLPGVLVAVLLGGQVFAIGWGREWWPFTCAPMFAHPATPDTITYEFGYLLHKPTGVVGLQFADLGLAPMFYQRGFFGAFYGSADPRTPQFGPLIHDQKELEEAVGTWMTGLAKVVADRRPDLWRGATAISLVIRSQHPTQHLVREVGIWQQATGHYTHTWSLP